MKQKNCFFAVAASLLLAAASFTSCTNQDNVVAPTPEEAGPDAFDEGSLIVNGRCEGSDVSNFFVKVGSDGVAVPANIKWDEVTPRNHCVVVEIRSEGEAKTAGNPATEVQWWSGNTVFAGYDTQFFISFGEENALDVKDQIRVTMSIKADAPFTAGTGAHAAPGSWLSGAFGNVNFTDQWTDYDSGWVTVSDNGPKVGTYSIGFDLSKGSTNRAFFDNIRVEVKRHDKWLDDNVLTNGRIEEEGEGTMKSFTSAEWVNGEKINADPNNPGNARRVVDPLDPNNHCIEVIARDPEGASIDNWDTQFFVTMPEALNEGDKFWFECRVRAEKAADSETQAHTAPTQYKHWDFVGHIPFTTEWKKFEKEVTVSSNQAGCNTIAVNLAVFKEANKYYFDDIKIKVEKAKPVENWETLCEYKGNDATNFSVKYFKYYVAAKTSGGAIVVESLDPDKVYLEYAGGQLSQDWDTQFLIGLPKTLAKGTKAKLTLKLKADKAATADIQAHLAIPAAGAVEGENGYGGSYLYHTLISGGASFTTDWATFEKEFTVPDDADGMQSICFNLEKLRETNKYYFKEIKVEVAK